MYKTLKTKVEWIVFTLLIFLLFILVVGGDFSYAVSDGIKLWVACVLPALFPYVFLTTILSSISVTGIISKAISPLTKRLFNVNGCAGYAFFISLLSGYPLGAKTVSELYSDGFLSDAEAVRSSALCSTSSPVFLITSVGSISFGSRKFGVLLFVTHLISAVINGIIFSFYKKSYKSARAVSSFIPKKMDNLLYESSYSAVVSVLVVGGLITIFYLLTEVLISLKILSPIISLLEQLTGDLTLAEGITLGIFECTKGIKRLSFSGITTLSLPVVSAICGFGGLSIIAQSLAYLKNAKIKTAPFVMSKLTSAVINFVVGLIISLLFLAQ